jgi:hypothetical protein
MEETTDSKDEPQTQTPTTSEPTLSLRPQYKFSSVSTSQSSATDSKKEPEIKQKEPVTKHPLHQTWVMLWESGTKPKVGKMGWGAGIKPIMEFCTVEDFWSLYNNLAAPTNLAARSNYHLFKSVSVL